MAPDPLLEQLRAAAAAFGDAAGGLDVVLATMAADVAKARSERLPIFPVTHHSPASAVHMVRWLREKAPKLVFVELCEDLIARVEDLKECTLPVAFQAFAGQAEGFPPAWAPLSVVAPITELSAEYQAIAYALTTPGVELVFVDRSVDHVFQWRDRGEDPDAPAYDDDDEEEARIHGDAVGLEVGDLVPTFADFRDFLLQNARMSHFEEWAALYIEEPTIGADTEAYREVMFLIGSLFRRLGSTPAHREEIRLRDRFMWTRIKETLAARDVAPEDAVFVCGAAHAVDDDCPEWGLGNDLRFDIPERTPTRWSLGVIPSSYAAIELQFGHGRGAVALAEGRWRKAVTTWGLQPFTLDARKAGKKVKAAKAPPAQLSLHSLLFRAPQLQEADEEELVAWCTRIVGEARKNRYLASTADAIAIYETAVLLARMRSRRRPSAYDFMDAAETCLEKGPPPGRRGVRQLCQRMLGGDRVGQVGYDSLPPLVQDVYDRLSPLAIDASTRRVVRVLMDFGKRPELRACSRLLWRLRWLLPHSRVARPILGELKLGMDPRQESWDVCISGAEQREVIQLAFEGVTIEQVLERRLQESAFGAGATAVGALTSAEGSVILLENQRLTAVLGQRAAHLLVSEPGVGDSQGIFELARRLVQHFLGTADGLPAWLQDLVSTGYQHYCSRLPEAFRDRGVKPEDLAAMLSFVFTLESLALSLGCSRSQLVLALEHAAPGTADPEKLGLLWAAEWLVQRRDEESVRDAFGAILAHPMGRQAYPRYLSGFLLALAFAPRAAPLGVALLGRAFSELPDGVLLPWLPGLLVQLRPRRGDALPALFEELMRSFPRDLPAVDRWVSPGAALPKPAPRAVATVDRSERAAAAGSLVFRHPEAHRAYAALLDLPEVDEVAPEAAAPPAGTGPAAELVRSWPATAEALGALLGLG